MTAGIPIGFVIQTIEADLAFGPESACRLDEAAIFEAFVALNAATGAPSPAVGEPGVLAPPARQVGLLPGEARELAVPFKIGDRARARGCMPPPSYR